MGNADLLPDGQRRAAVVAREHDHIDAEGTQLLHRLPAGRLHDVRHGDETEQPALFREEERRAALPGKSIRLCLQAAGGNADLPQHAAVPGKDAPAADNGGNALPLFRGELLCLRQIKTLRALQDGECQRVIGALFHGGGQKEQFLLLHAGNGADLRHLRAALRDSAGLIEHNGVHTVDRFQAFRCLE